MGGWSLKRWNVRWQVWNMSTLQQQSLSGPKGQVHEHEVTDEGLLFAGTQVSVGDCWVVVNVEGVRCGVGRRMRRAACGEWMPSGWGGEWDGIGQRFRLGRVLSEWRSRGEARGMGVWGRFLTVVGVWVWFGCG